MNRRKFLTNLGALGLFSILPGRVKMPERKIATAPSGYLPFKEIKYLKWQADLVLGINPYQDSFTIPVIYRSVQIGPPPEFFNNEPQIIPNVVGRNNEGS